MSGVRSHSPKYIRLLNCKYDDVPCKKMKTQGPERSVPSIEDMILNRSVRKRSIDLDYAD